MRSLRWKIILTTLLVVLIPIYFLNQYAIRFFDTFTRTALERHLKHYAFIVGEQYRALLASGDADDAAARERFLALMSAFARETETHIRIVEADGRVRFDSHPGADAPISGRSELLDALAGRYSARSRLTPDRKYMYYYIARPVRGVGRHPAAAVYVVTHTSPIIRAIQRMIANQRRATWIAGGASVAAAGILALTLTRRLRRLTAAARDYASGRRTFDVAISGGDEIADLARATEQMTRELEKRNGYNKDFVSTTSHELHTPLTAIRGAVEILEQGAADNPDARRKFLGNIRHQTERMIRMVGELRELTRLDTEMLQGQKTPTDYIEFVRAVVARLEPTFDAAHAPLRLELPDDRVQAPIVPGRIEQVISNLLDNAFRYTPAGGEVTLAVHLLDRHTLCTSVRDTGRGIAPSNIERVFDRFFTTEPQDGAKPQGSGLGLAIARTIVENHGGRIWVESEPGRGAAFHFTLPAG